MKHLFIFLIFLYDLSLITSTVLNLVEGNSFLRYIDIENGVLRKCVLHIPNGNISLYPNKINNFNDTIKQKLVSLEPRACGFKLINFRRNDPKDYKLSAEIVKNGKVIIKEDEITITRGTPSILNNITQVVGFGETIRLQCSVSGKSYEFCSLYSPVGELQTQGTNCQYEIKYIRKEHFGSWKCEITLNGYLEPTSMYINVQLQQNPLATKTWYKEQNGYGVIGCQFPTVTASSKNNYVCSMITPTKHIFNVEPYSASTRYDGYGTNYSQKICQIEFKLPVQKHEIGTWTCVLNRETAFIQVKAESKFPKELNYIVKLGDTKSFECKVPFSAKNCFIVTPSGNIINRGTLSGCNEGIIPLYITLNKQEDFGRYECHFGKLDSYNDVVVTMNVKRYDLVIPNINQKTVNEGEDTSILFTANGPITYCILEDPNNNMYHIWPKTKTNFMEYHGKGFELGECGITLKQVNKSHEGVWKCMTNLNENEETMDLMASTQLNVRTAEEAAIEKASASSILIGVLVAIFVFVLFLIYAKYQKSVKAKISPANSIGDENSETVFILRSL